MTELTEEIQKAAMAIKYNKALRRIEQLEWVIREAIEDTQNCIDGEASLQAMEYLNEDLKSALEKPQD